MAIKTELQKSYAGMAAYIGEWGEGLNKEKLIGNIHRNLLGVDKLGRTRPMEDLAFFLLQAKQYGLNPLKNEIYATYQSVKMGNAWVEKLVPIPSIHGLRRIARESKSPTYSFTGKAKFEFSDAEKKNLDNATVEVFGYFGDPKNTVKIGEYTAYMEEFCRKKSDGTTTKQWQTMPRVMLAKCAEANALRATFGLGGIYVEEEMGKAVASNEEDQKLIDGGEE